MEKKPISVDDASSLTQPPKLEKRSMCPRCKRPTPRGCICEEIPEDRIPLHQSRIIVLQHPNELRHKNRSLPLLELSLRADDLKVFILRRLGDQVDEDVMAMLQDDTQPLILMYPGDDAVSLQEGLDLVKTKYLICSKINLLVLDATWKFSREMDMANIREKLYPSHMIRIALSKEDFPTDFTPRRFDIRAPPSPDHLSTAESIAWVLTKLENKPSLYEQLMKPLDAMVKKWHSFSRNQNRQTVKRSLDDEDNERITKNAGSKIRKLVKIKR